MSNTDEAIQAVRQSVRDFAAREKVSVRQIANMAGLHWNTLRSFEEPDWMPKTSTMKKLEALIGEPEA